MINHMVSAIFYCCSLQNEFVQKLLDELEDEFAK